MTGPSRVQRVVSDAATDWAFGIGWQLVRRLPETAAYRLFDLAADGIWRRRGAGVEQFERNLLHINPDLTRSELADLSRLGMRSYLRYWCDAFRLPTWSRAKVNTFALERRELLDEAMAAGNGAIVALSHGGNWDHAGAWACQRYGPLTTVAERLKPEGLFDKFVAYRESLGMEILPLGAPNLIRTLARRLGEGRLVPLLGDRDISRNGVRVDLCGAVASLPAGPAALAALTGAPLFVMTSWYRPDGAVGLIHDQIQVPPGGDRTQRVQRTTQAIADAFSTGLREHGVDWHMMQPVWLEDLDNRHGSRS